MMNVAVPPAATLHAHGFGREGKLGEVLITGGLHPAMRSGVRAAREVREAMGALD